MADEKLEQNKQEETSSLLGRSLLTGFIGGIFFSLLGQLMYYFNFMEVSAKSYILRSWTKAAWTDTWLGHFITILMIGILSVGVAFLYYGMLKKVNSLWMGVLYGIVLWAIVYFVFQPMFANVPSVQEMEAKSVVTIICLYILYGTFIGYSISFDYKDTTQSKVPDKKNDAAN